jgi:hypothetical protein
VASTSYSPYDCVSDNNSSFVCILATSGSTHPQFDGTHWALIAAQGSPGTAAGDNITGNGTPGTLAEFSTASLLVSSPITDNSTTHTLSTTDTFTSVNVPLNSNLHSIFWVIPAGGVINTGVSGDLALSENYTILSWQMVINQTDNFTMSIRQKSSQPLAAADNITGSGPPTITNGISATGTSFSGWSTTTLAAGNWLEFNVDSNTGATRCTLILNVQQQ